MKIETLTQQAQLPLWQDRLVEEIAGRVAARLLPTLTTLNDALGRTNGLLERLEQHSAQLSEAELTSLRQQEYLIRRILPMLPEVPS